MFSQNTFNAVKTGIFEILKTVTVDVFVSSPQVERGVRILKTPGQYPIITKVQTNYVIDPYHITPNPSPKLPKPRKSRKKTV